SGRESARRDLLRRDEPASDVPGFQGGAHERDAGLEASVRLQLLRDFHAEGELHLLVLEAALVVAGLTAHVRNDARATLGTVGLDLDRHADRDLPDIDR